MTIWVVRAGRYGEREDQALEEGYSFIGWSDVTDLSGFQSKEAVRERLEEAHPDEKPARIMNHAGQIWTFYKVIQKGDIIALPLKNRPAIAFGEVTGDYEYRPENPEDAKHCRPVKWLGEPILRSRFDEDLRYSFGGAMTVFSVHRNNAEERVRKILAQPLAEDEGVETSEEASEPAPNLLDTAAQQISDYIGRRFKGRKLEKLVEAILKAQGYETNLCPEGADGGVDILAGRGAMGFEPPRLCVQVKSSDSAVGTEVLSQLKGVMGDHDADHGLLVAWGGFKSTVMREARRGFFNIRLWNDQKLVEEIQEVYEKLPKEIQAELPLQRAWVLVEEE
jgi:restriction system protein